ncbi:unnamed protein product [Cyclocybe aegerita]|uniref:Uncharacterized protein n=1 Tax=Cyclocybe aegerita TaxID=1973307 RepID=A0A8S0W458_CYCAE|nr:unnamed protein product [Cyclocybe aegerita]
MFGFSKVFRFSKKEKKPTVHLPPNWPSSLHNKCDVPTCLFPNPPQAAEGRYNCQGGFRGFECQGTYFVTGSMARTMVKNHVFLTRRASDVRFKAQKALEAHRQRLIELQQAMAEAKVVPAATYGLKVAYEPSTQCLSTKSLPPTPGLSQRPKRRPSAPRLPPSPAPSAPAGSPVHRPLHPRSVRQHYPADRVVHHCHNVSRQPRPLPSSASRRTTAPSQQSSLSVQNHTRQYGSSYTYAKF